MSREIETTGEVSIMNSGLAVARLQILRRVVSDEYGPAIDYALELLAQQQHLVAREQVVSLLTARAQATNYVALQRTLLDLAETVSGLRTPR